MQLPASVHGQPCVLAVNTGSSSLKVGLYAAPDSPAFWSGTFEGLEPGGSPRWTSRGVPPRPLPATGSASSPYDAALSLLSRSLDEAQIPLLATAHRIVHGADRFIAPCRLGADDLHALQELAPLAPLHQPHNVAGVVAIQQRWPQLPAIGCFDTAFHASLPAMERLLPLPESLAMQGLRRYGFHGLSYEFVASQLRGCSDRAGGRVLMAHLGSGSSLCGMCGGRSVATSMGFSALDGLMMGSRSGSLDPGVILHLWRTGWSLQQVEALLYRNSGLKGVSGLSADMRELRRSEHPRAALAIALYEHRARREAGALASLLEGLDVVAFTGGIGEHDAAIRAALAQSLAAQGLRLDPGRNLAADGRQRVAIHADDSAVQAWVVPTDEGRVAATAAFHLIQGRTHGSADLIDAAER